MQLYTAELKKIQTSKLVIYVAGVSAIFCNNFWLPDYWHELKVYTVWVS